MTPAPSSEVESVSLSEMGAGRRGRFDSTLRVAAVPSTLGGAFSISGVSPATFMRAERVSWAKALPKGETPSKSAFPRGGSRSPSPDSAFSSLQPFQWFAQPLGTSPVPLCPYLSLLGGPISCLPRVLRCPLGFWKSIIWNRCTFSIVVLDQSSFQVSASQCWDQTPHHGPKQRNEATR